MNFNELTPFVFFFGSVSLIIVILCFPFWFFFQVASLRRSIHYLREDIEEQEEEINQLRSVLAKTPPPTEQMDDFGI